MSDDGWTWRGGAVRPGGGVAPDVIHIGNRYYMTYARGGGGMSGGHASNVYVMWTKTLDPKSPDFGFHDETLVASSDGVEDCDAIDPAFLLDPTTGRLWLSYGTYFGYIRLVELDPKTGKRVVGNKAVNIAIDMEATALMYRDGWYYLLGTHGTCCDGANSTYNIRVARSRKVTGPYVDNVGIDALKGGGKLVVAASGRFVGPGHFGLLDLGDGVQKFSCHYEADLDRSGRSVLDIRPLLWKDGWPYAGDNFVEGTYEIQSERSGYALELVVDFVRMAIDETRWPWPRWSTRGAGRAGSRCSGSKRPGGWPAGSGRTTGRRAWPAGCNARRPWRRRTCSAAPTGPVTPVPAQDLAEASKDWAAGTLGIRLGDYMFRPHQKWTITPVGRRRRLSRRALFQDHDRRHRAHAGCNRRRGSGGGSEVHRQSRTTLAHRPADRRHLSHHAQVGARFEGAVRADRSRPQHAHAGEVRSQERQGSLELQEAVGSTRPSVRRADGSASHRPRS